jgi:hypothetical protein
MGSRGCRRVNTIEEFYEAAKTAISFSNSGRAIAEEYMEGPEFSIDAIIYHSEITICGLADRHIFFPPYFIEMGHTMPTAIAEEKQTAILQTFCAGIHALGLSGKDNIGAAKGDIKLTQNGPMIGEIAARLSGGYMSGWTYPYSSGALPIKAAILAAMGRKPEGLIRQKNWTCAERAFISIPGTVKQIISDNKHLTVKNGQLEINSDYVNDIFLRIAKGDKVSFPENNVTKCGNIIACAPDRDTAITAAEKAARSILIRLDPTDNKTKAFLAGFTSVFPPDAFQLTEELQEVLNQLPDNNENTAKNSAVPPCLCVSSSLTITPFPALESSDLRDYMGRTVKEALDAVRQLTGFPLPEDSENAENKIRLGRSFWAAFVRGSYQGAVYYIDSLGVKIDSD